MSLIDQSSKANARITLGGLTVVVKSIVNLRALSGPDLMGTAQTQYGASFQDGLGLTYIWNPTDTTPDNGSTTIAPYLGPATGRWNYLAGSGAGTTGSTWDRAYSATGVSVRPAIVNGNLEADFANSICGTTYNNGVRGSVPKSAGKRYFEIYLKDVTPFQPQLAIGILWAQAGGIQNFWTSTEGGLLAHPNDSSSSVLDITDSAGSDDVISSSAVPAPPTSYIGVLVDLDAQGLAFYWVNNTLITVTQSLALPIAGRPYCPCFCIRATSTVISSGQFVLNCGSQPFNFGLPSGYTSWDAA